MNRLTKIESESDGCKFYTNNFFVEDTQSDYNMNTISADREQYYNRCQDKLGQLEDIEEELGVDLVTLFNARNGFYFINDNREIENISDDYYVVTYNVDSIEVYKDHKQLYDLKYKGYGKTWALTKEELGGKPKC